ncbi:Coenzyme F420 hydrogenase/dehydrogenase, beta subunit C-terminal domain [Methanocorpusculum parvum]|uniref:4Fe-4S ferredoxin-type domain-containing protein n=1 Tax=Methanocorpusculum parvum TaxID=2193 RepID=A0AAX0Q842_9EURY|nr:Coenzyme F420 hydrogenase/dehydrogenase, beta subunit C-terminal domain [Methanocorpusculum parvum]PAV09389.1 hypothetical protein ASJ83_07915 [Methanocorpusculum parvum]
MTTVLDTVVKNSLCSGCGVCAALCPKHALKITWNANGEYTPIRVRDCGKECELCIKVCPFSDGNPSEDQIGKEEFSLISDIHYCSETGYYLSSGVGAVSSDEKRLASVSGGLTTWLLQSLMQKKIVDNVICVSPRRDSHKLFEFTIAKTEAEVSAAAGSAYYPVEMSEVISYVLENPGRYAIVGVPCFLKALRLAQTRNKFLKERLVVMVGLVCGLIPNTNLTRYMHYSAGLDDEIASVCFRIKHPDKPASRHCTRTEGISGEKSAITWNKNNISFARQCLALHACDCCDDVFAECADVTFMDAWLPEYSQDTKGTNIYLSRSKLVDELIQNGREQKTLSVTDISIDKVIESQQPRLHRKRNPLLGYRLSILKDSGKVLPKKRVWSNKERLTVIDKYQCRRLLKLKESSREEFKKSNGDCRYMSTWFAKNAKGNPIMRTGIFLGKACRYALRKLGFQT